jgi:hypothetical protein
MIYHSKISDLMFAKFVLSSSFRSHHKTNPTPNNGGSRYLALPTRHPILTRSRSDILTNTKIGILQSKNNMRQNSMWKALHTTRRFGVMAAVARKKCSATLQVCTPPEIQWKPPLRQAAGTLGASVGRHSSRE